MQDHEAYYVAVSWAPGLAFVLVSLVALSVISFRMNRRGVWLALPWVIMLVGGGAAAAWAKVSLGGSPEFGVRWWDVALIWIQSGGAIAILISLVVLAVAGSPRSSRVQGTA